VGNKTGDQLAIMELRTKKLLRIGSATQIVTTINHLVEETLYHLREREFTHLSTIQALRVEVDNPTRT